MYGRERRQVSADSVEMTQLKSGLTTQQLGTMSAMAQFGWSLKFVRRPMFRPSVPVMFDRGRRRYAVIEEDGAINENPGFTIRA